MTRRAFCALLIAVVGALADEDDDGVRPGPPLRGPFFLAHDVAPMRWRAR